MSVAFLHRNIRSYIPDDVGGAVDEAAAAEMLYKEVGDDESLAADVELKGSPPSTALK
jgi:hypothetical protein